MRLISSGRLVLADRYFIAGRTEPFNENVAQVKRLINRDRKEFMGNSDDILDKYTTEFGDGDASASTPGASRGVESMQYFFNVRVQGFGIDNRNRDLLNWIERTIQLHVQINKPAHISSPLNAISTDAINPFTSSKGSSPLPSVSSAPLPLSKSTDNPFKVSAASSNPFGAPAAAAPKPFKQSIEPRVSKTALAWEHLPKVNKLYLL